MYEVTDAYKAAMKQPVQRFRMTGTIGKYKFNDDNILSGSFHLTNQCSDDTNISIGSVYIGELKVTLTGIPFVRGTLDDLEIQPVLGLMIADGSFEDIPLGVFHVSAADWGTSGVAITAYDNMARFDKNAAVTEMGTSTLFHFLEAACRSCGVAMGMTDLEVEALPNGTEQLSFYSENDIETWRDVVSWCAQTAGCFATMDRAGRLVLKPYSDTPVDTIDMEHRFAGGKFSDFITRYTGASVVNIADKTTSYYGVIPDDLLTNPYYTGDYMNNKTTVIIRDHKPVRVDNDGLADQYYIEEHQEALVSHEDFDFVQELIGHSLLNAKRCNFSEEEKKLLEECQRRRELH